MAQSLQDSPRVHVNGARYIVGVNKVPGKRLYIAVEDDAYHFAFFVDGGTAGIAANDIRSGDEIQRRLEIQLWLGLHPAVCQLVRRLIIVLRSMLECAADSSVIGNWFAI